MNLIPYSRYARTVLNFEKKKTQKKPKKKNTLSIREFLDEPDTPLTFEWPHPRELKELFWK